MMIKPYLRLMRLDKLIGIFLLLWPTCWALLIASNGRPSIKYLLAFVIGVVLTRSAGCVINDIADINYDGKVKRTQQRPLVTKELRIKAALILFCILSILALIDALIFLHFRTIMLAVAGFLLYLSYPYTKRFFFIPQLYLAISFSLGILMVFLELTGKLGLISWLLFSANLFWVFGYDTIYALVDLKDDLTIGIKSSAITLGSSLVRVLFICYLSFVILLEIIGKILKLNPYYYVALLIVGVVLLLQIYVVKTQNEDRLWSMFLINNQVGFIILLGILLGYS